MGSGEAEGKPVEPASNPSVQFQDVSLSTATHKKLFFWCIKLIMYNRDIVLYNYNERLKYIISMEKFRGVISFFVIIL